MSNNTGSEARIAELLEDGFTGTCLDICKALGIKKVTGYFCLMRLHEQGLAEVVGAVQRGPNQAHLWACPQEAPKESAEKVVRRAMATQPPLVRVWNEAVTRQLELAE